MADAMSYEYLLRRIYQVGRHDNKDIDADVFRKLEHAERLYVLELENIEKKQPRISTKSIDDIAYDYRIECRKIWSIISVAITKSIAKYKEAFSIEDVMIMQKAFEEPKNITKEHIDNAIDTAEKIFVKHKIYPA